MEENKTKSKPNILPHDNYKVCLWERAYPASHNSSIVVLGMLYYLKTVHELALIYHHNLYMVRPLITFCNILSKIPKCSPA